VKKKKANCRIYSFIALKRENQNILVHARVWTCYWQQSVYTKSEILQTISAPKHAQLKIYRYKLGILSWNVFY